MGGILIMFGNWVYFFDYILKDMMEYCFNWCLIYFLVVCNYLYEMFLLFDYFDVGSVVGSCEISIVVL